MRVLVTGSGGRIGRNIYTHLMSWCDAKGIAVLTGSTVDHIGDIRAPKLLKEALHGVDVVIHTAALHAPHVGNRSKDEFIDINVYATELLANIAAQQGVFHMVFTSTTALYGAASTPDGKRVGLQRIRLRYPKLFIIEVRFKQSTDSKKFQKILELKL